MNMRSRRHDRMQGNWKQLIGGVHHEWGTLTYNDVEETKGDVEALAGKIEERYGVTKAVARKQIELWVGKFLAHQMEQSNSNTPANYPVGAPRLSRTGR